MSRYSTVVFDVGGTLLGFNLDALARAYIEASARLGVSLDLTRTRTVIQTLEGELPARVQQHLLSLDPDNGRAFWDEFYLEGFRRLGVTSDRHAPEQAREAAATLRERFQRAEFESLYDDTLPALDALTTQGYVLGILSNFSANCENVLRQMGIHDYFRFFVVSALAGVEKPDPKIFELTVQTANRPREEIIYVGDSLYHDFDGARRAGLGALLVDRTHRYPEREDGRISSLNDLLYYLETN